MNKNALTAVIVAILLAVGVGVFVMSKSSTSPVTTSPAENMAEEPLMGTTGDQKMTLKSLLDYGANQTCTFEDIESDSTGIIYLGDGMARADFETQTEEGPMISNMISDGTTMYLWFEGQESGFKASIDSFEELPYSGTEESAEAEDMNLDVNREVDYQCNDWSLDQSMFVLPSDVEFVDYSVMMEESLQMLQEQDSTNTRETDSVNCSVCDSLPGEAQAQCKQSLGC